MTISTKSKNVFLAVVVIVAIMGGVWGTLDLTTVFLDAPSIIAEAFGCGGCGGGFDLGGGAGGQGGGTYEPPVGPPPSCDYFTATPSTITAGQSATLAW